jgi:ferredoxin--NADP+ reductase
VEIRGDGKVESIVLAVNALYRDDSGAIRARDTGKREELECGLVLRSIGYAGVPLEGLPFDERRAVVANEGGRVIDPPSGERIPGHYVVGWIKRGPSGVIGTNKKDAQETVDAIFEDLAAGVVPERAPVEPGIEELLAQRDADVVGYDGWRAIDEAEQERGRPQGRPRVKFCRIDEMVEASRSRAPVSG